MQSNFDVIVVGSGPAGSAAAVQARRAGLSVALVDKATFPRKKLCGGLVTGRSRKAIKAIFGAEVEGQMFLKATEMRFSAKGRLLADLADGPPVHLTMRWDFDEWLHGFALEAGAVPFLGQGFTAIDETARRITLKDGTALHYGVLIGADGVNSAVARALFGRPFDPETIGFGLEIEAPGTAMHDYVEVDLDAAVWGYGWAFPKHHSTTIGVGGIKSRNADMKAHMAAYLERCGLEPDAIPYKGQFLPFGDFKKVPGRGPVLLCGDAAGLVDPITGEGIALAMESGALAATAAAEALAAQAPETALRRYRTALRPMHQSLREARMWRSLMFPKAMREVFLSAFARGTSLQNKYLRLLAGEIEYRDLRLMFLRKAPKAAIRAIGRKLRPGTRAEGRP
ncbi:Putative oxidoreductase/MT0587 [Pseudoruegeria aquimaris]|uniref:Putative oxidoreductase/MT0587 n=2 Tax=Pseudoruegeria aquimaris TaxID=393663 RepID=A0A1Y5RDI8_9RHOB|nr:Putative oxidoreductase/MT0587 [Pseudoruegeria aquimaris]